jgi:hypothetical protein
MIRSIFALLLSLASFAAAAENLGALPEVPYERLSERAVTSLSQKALAIRAADWKHAETEHFIYHFFDRPTASAVSVEAEFYYRVIAKELGKDTAGGGQKCHVFIFHDEADWKQFQQGGGMDPWTGGLHSEGTLFFLRNPGWKANDSTLPHEIAHLVLHRFFGNGIPLWLHEGFAEYAGSRCRAAFYRARGFNAKPRGSIVPADGFIPLSEFTVLATYPQKEEAVIAFYAQSEKLVRFLSNADKAAFLNFLDVLSKGSRFDSALSQTFGRKYPTLASLELEFKPYAISPLAPGAN